MNLLEWKKKALLMQQQDILYEYMQENLIFHVDGKNIESNTIWRSVVGSNYLPFSNIKSGYGKKDNCYQIYGTYSDDFTNRSGSTINFGNYWSYEYVVKLNTVSSSDVCIFTIQNANSCALMDYFQNANIDSFKTNGYSGDYSVSALTYNTIYTITHTYNNGTHKVYINGTLKTTFTRNMTLGNWNITIGIHRVHSKRTAILNANYYSCRVYSNTLSESEVKQNYEIDKKRFS